MKNNLAKVIICALLLVAGGCAGQKTELKLTQPDGSSKNYTLPEGTLTGHSSTEQASTLGQVLADSHNVQMATQKDETRMVLDAIKQDFEIDHKTIIKLEEMSRKYGSGEITIFFPVGSGKIPAGEMNRLVSFTDYLSKKSMGRKVHLVMIGSASKTGKSDKNQQIALKRAEAPINVIDKYLVNIPHEYYKVYSLGDTHSPQITNKSLNNNYQHTRIIAFYDMKDCPADMSMDKTMPMEKKMHHKKMYKKMK